MQLVDTHVHLNFDVFQGDLDAVALRWREAGVRSLVHSCVCPEEFESIKVIAHKFPELYFAVGLHPLDASKWEGEKTYQKIRQCATSDSKVVAIGEMGLDFYKAQDTQRQKELLWQQLAIARQLDKPAIIHCRDAAESLREVVVEFQRQQGEVRGVMHCWGGTPEETEWFLDLGFYISFSGTVTFKNARQVQESAQIVPKERLLIETDCPFLAPVPRRGKRNEPAYVLHVAETLAKIRNVPLENLAAETTENARELFNLKGN